MSFDTDSSQDSEIFRVHTGDMSSSLYLSLYLKRRELKRWVFDRYIDMDELFAKIDKEREGRYKQSWTKLDKGSKLNRLT